MSWSRRFDEAYKTLASMPMATRPKQYGNAMPTVVRQQLTNKDWIDLYESGELQTQQEEQNRVRIAPTSAQVTRMEQALRWPFEYLNDKPELAKAVQLRSMWAAMGVDIRKRCERRSINHAIFNTHWQQALAIITGALIARRMPVS